MSDLFVTLVKKYAASADRFPKGTHSTTAVPRWLFHDGCSTTAVPRRLFHDGFIFFSVASLDLEYFESDAYFIDGR
jgi:hypothetical protein